MTKKRLFLGLICVVLLAIPLNHFINNWRGHRFEAQLIRLKHHSSVSLIESSNFIRTDPFVKGCVFVSKGIFSVERSDIDLDAVKVGLSSNNITQPFPSREPVVIKSVNIIEEESHLPENSGAFSLEYLIVSKRFSPWLDSRCWVF